jgi:hypothetical protein
MKVANTYSARHLLKADVCTLKPYVGEERREREEGRGKEGQEPTVCFEYQSELVGR